MGHTGALIQLLPLVISGFFAALLLVLGASARPGTPRAWLGYLALVGAGIAAILAIWEFDWVTSQDFFDGMIRVDRFSVFGMAIMSVSAALSALLTVSYFDDNGPKRGEFHPLMLLSLMGAMTLVLAQDLLCFYVALELTTLPLFALTAFHRRRSHSVEAGLKFYLSGALSSGLTVMGVAFLYGACGATSYEALSECFSQNTAHNMAFAGLGFAFLFSGLAIRIGLVPFHAWLPDAYEGAPAPTAAFMDGVFKSALVLALIQLLANPLEAFVNSMPHWSLILEILAAASILLGALVAIVQTGLKRRLAYSSIAHTGFMLAAIAAAQGESTTDATAALLFYLFFHISVSLGLYAVVLILSRYSGENPDIKRDLAGLGYRSPAVGAAFTALLLSYAGAPPTMGFFARFFILQSLLSSDHLWLAVILGVGMMIMLYYVLRIIVVMYTPAESENDQAKVSLAYPVPLTLALIAATALNLLLGIFPSGLLELASQAAVALF